jgi:hypothetical protein
MVLVQAAEFLCGPSVVLAQDCGQYEQEGKQPHD